MATFIAIFSVVSSAASIAGLLLQLFGGGFRAKTFVTMVMLCPALAFSSYLFFVPSSQAVQQVSAKIRVFSKTTDGDTQVQEGSFSLAGVNRTYAIQFYEPFRDAPDVRILNIHGYADVEIPEVIRVTNHFFEVKRRGSSGLELVPTFLQEYKWVAVGQPLKQAAAP